jgi:hypothetical protein
LGDKDNRFSVPNSVVAEAELAYSIAQEIEEARGNMTSESGCTGLTSEKQKSIMKSDAKTLTPIEEGFAADVTPDI